MRNLFAQFRALVPTQPLQVGTVAAVAAGMITVELPGGGRLRVRGEAAVGQAVFVRGGVVEGEAPNLPLELIDV